MFSTCDLCVMKQCNDTEFETPIHSPDFQQCRDKFCDYQEAECKCSNMR